MLRGRHKITSTSEKRTFFEKKISKQHRNMPVVSNVWRSPPTVGARTAIGKHSRRSSPTFSAHMAIGKCGRRSIGHPLQVLVGENGPLLQHACTMSGVVRHSGDTRYCILERVQSLEYRACSYSLQKRVRGADCTTAVADRRRMHGDREMQSATDRRPLQGSVVRAHPSSALVPLFKPCLCIT